MADYINEFFLKNGLSDELRSRSAVKRCERSRALCRDCRGLFACTQKMAGQRSALRYDDVILEEMEYCSYALEKMKADKVSMNFVYSDIPEEYKNLDLRNIDLPDQQIKAYMALILRIYKKTVNKGLYVYGEMGTGKTYMMMALANSLVKEGRKTAFVKVSSFVNEMRKTAVEDPDRLRRMVVGLKNAEVVIFDDIGSESVSSFSRDDLLFDILDHRMEHGLLTCFTSNFSKADLLEHYTFEKGGKGSLMAARRLHERIDILSDDFVLTGSNKRR